ncbi:PAS domain-containing protein [Pararhodobacter oceanensis]|uniref:PAS domain-containing protein n=1 Tax=Pararhodobacter oceanensis TaxID=2172121 RepID=UPI003A8F6710
MTVIRIFDDHAAPEAATGVSRLTGLFQPQPLSYPAVDTVVSHWEVLRGQKLAPARAQIDPRCLGDCLDKLFIAEQVAPGIARFRLCGQQFTNLLGMEPRGMPLSVLFAHEARGNLAAALRQVAQGVRAVLPLRAEKGLGRPGMDGLLALMPLTDHEGNITRILGVMETHGQVGHAPRKFRLTTPLPQGMERQTSAPAPAPERPSSKPLLRVLKGGLSA